MATRTANIIARVEPSLKTKTETILDQIGLSMSDAINLYCKQIVLNNGIPFSLKSEIPSDVDASSWTDKEIAEEVKRSIAEINAGLGCSAEEVFAKLDKDYERGI